MRREVVILAGGMLMVTICFIALCTYTASCFNTQNKRLKVLTGQVHRLNEIAAGRAKWGE